MKKGLQFLTLLLFIALGVNSQTIVSTTPENKNVILEEFTGIHCVYCPQGHAIAQGIKDAHPDDVFLINIHTGSYSTPSTGEPDFRTDFGAGIVGQTGMGLTNTGYPGGTVNRHNFPGLEQGGNSDITLMGRSNWVNASNQTLAQSSYVNVAVEAEINVATRELTVHIETYYTGDSPESTNLLNVAILQDNTLGPQVGGNAGDEYVHMHRLVWMLTGQWGEVVSTTTTGTFVDRTFNYTIPADYKGVLAELADIKIVAFISETQQEIASGNGCLPTYTGFANNNDASVEAVIVPNEACNPLHPTVKIRNEGDNDITSLNIQYSINGGATQTYNWNGTISPLRTEDIMLDEISFVSATANTISISINSDDDNSNNTGSANFNDAPAGTNVVNMVLHTDSYGSECSWDLKNSSGTVLYSGGPYGNNQTINEIFTLDLDCYTFNIYDSYGDGGGAITLEDSDGTIYYSTNGLYGSGESQQFGTVTDNTGISQIDDNIVIYPNPANDVLFISNAKNSTITISDLSGKTVLKQNVNSEVNEINISNFTSGMYFIKIEQTGHSAERKLNIIK